MIGLAPLTVCACGSPQFIAKGCLRVILTDVVGGGGRGVVAAAIVDAGSPPRWMTG
jgi:hypothetical protein